MKTKKIPAIVMLLAGSITCVVTYINGYNLKDMLVALVWALILFFFLGVIVELLFEKFEIAKEEEPESDDGEVVDKTSENSEDNPDENGDSTVSPMESEGVDNQ